MCLKGIGDKYMNSEFNSLINAKTAPKASYFKVSESCKLRSVF